MRLPAPTPVIAVAAALGLTACSPGKTLMAAGSAVGSGIGAAAGAVGSVAGGAASAVGSLGGGGGGGETAMAETVAVEGTAAAEPVVSAATPSPTPGESNRPFMTMGGATVAQAGTAATASVTAAGAPAALAEGIAGCIDSFDPSVAAGAAFAGTWTYAREGGPDVSEEEKMRAMRKSGVAASMVPGQRCTFRSNSISGVAARATARNVLDDTLSGEYTAGSPYGRTGDCEGYTFIRGGVKLWMYFTDAQGGICNGAGTGAGVTITPAR